MRFDWNPENNQLLKAQRNISFEEIAILLADGKVWKVMDHPNQNDYPRPQVFLVPINNYIFFVPFVIEKDVIFFKPPFFTERLRNNILRRNNMDAEEQMIHDAFEQGKVSLQVPDPELLTMLQKAGQNTFRKDKRINIRLSHHDLEGIQRKASRKGIPYQALISGLIHQYVEGDLVEKTPANQ